MGTIADKLLYLDGTKTALRGAINAAGGTLDTADPFRSYAAELYDKIVIPKLFANGEKGAWYDPSDLSTLFQDAAGTIPVTSAGDPVGRMLDKSGRGNHATQSVSAARPTYQTNGALHWLLFDGVDDHLSVPGAVGDATKNQLIVTAISLSASGQFQCLLGNTGRYLKLDFGAGGRAVRLVAYAAGGAAGTAERTPLALAERAVLTTTHDRTANMLTQKKNGENPLSVTTSGNLVDGVTLGLGIDIASNTRPFAGNFFGMVIVGVNGTISTTTPSEQYMAYLSGVNLL